MATDLELIKLLAFGDLERELTVTRAVLDRLPEDRYDWKPHEKSMTLGRLAMHVATMPDWERSTLATDDLDVSTMPQMPTHVTSRAQLLSVFDASVAALRKTVADFDVRQFASNWTIRSGPQVMNTSPRTTVHRIWCLNHMVHHRGQLCLYLRLLNIPVPTI